jgi:DNA-binding CsgD family transcriptional regulator
MNLVERDSYLSLLQTKLSEVADGEGHCVFVCGESGIGKTSLLKAFKKVNNKEYQFYEGVCDAMFTPRPLAPLYDIAWQIRHDLIHDATDMQDRAGLFTRFFQELKTQEDTSVIIFEDIHWADEATLDFIKFIARRISQISCLFVLTYRDNEIHDNNALISVMGQLSPDSHTRIKLAPLSHKAVKSLAEEKGYNGDEVFRVSGGNPFFVNEILASYSEGVPATIRDGIVSAYNRTGEHTRHVWDLLSVVPGKFETKYLETFDPHYLQAIENCTKLQILIQENGQIFFKHELFRRTIENALSPLKRIELNKKILELFLSNFERNHEIERIVHHAKNANDYELVVRYAPLAAKQAAAVGAHIEASKLLFTAIENYQGDDDATLITLYEAYAYECYLTNDIKQAIVYAGKRLKLLKRGSYPEQTANCTRFLSHLWWLDGDRNAALKLAKEAIDGIEMHPSSAAKAMAYSNMAQLKMLTDEHMKSLEWGHKAIIIAEEIGDPEALCHALNTVGTIRMSMPTEQKTGIGQLQESLSIALKNSFDEHAARAYTNLIGNGMKLKEYALVESIIDEGIRYAEERELGFWTSSMLSAKAKLLLEKGNLNAALQVADGLLKNKYEGSFKIYSMLIKGLVNMRTGELDPKLLLEAKALSFKRNELQVMIPTFTALLEYEWLTGQTVITTEELEFVLANIDKSVYYIYKNELAFWLNKARNQHWPLEHVYQGFEVDTEVNAHRSAAHWQKAGNRYLYAQTLFEGNSDDKKKAVGIVHELGAEAVAERMKQLMRSSGIKGIPRGMRKSTRSNTALLTEREMDVLKLLKDGLQNKEIASKLFISAKTVDHHISAILFKLDVNSRVKAVTEAARLELIK